MEFAYNNGHQSSIDMAPFEVLYGRKCRTPICWEKVGERNLLGPKLVQMTTENIHVIRANLKTISVLILFGQSIVKESFL